MMLFFSNQPEKWTFAFNAHLLAEIRTKLLSGRLFMAFTARRERIERMQPDRGLWFKGV
jgi:hypothetical protein